MQGNMRFGVKLGALALGALLAGGIAVAPEAKADEAGFKGKSAGDIVVRARALWVAPQESSSVSPIGGKVSVGNDLVPELDFSYFVTDNIAVEAIAGTTRHKVNHPQSGTDLGKVSLLPPTVTVQYHFMPKERLSPYVGAGLNYTFFYDVDSGAATSIKYDNHIGYALQAGVDYALGGNWSLNLDVKKIFLKTTASVNGGAIKADVDLDPWLVGVGVGYRF
jgi:outer membrane protein